MNYYLLYSIAITAVAALSLYINWVRSQKIKILQKYTADFLSDLIDIKNKINAANQIIKDADIRGSFESDDEVGGAFKIIKNAIENLTTYEISDGDDSSSQ